MAKGGPLRVYRLNIECEKWPREAPQGLVKHRVWEVAKGGPLRVYRLNIECGKWPREAPSGYTG